MDQTVINTAVADWLKTNLWTYTNSMWKQGRKIKTADDMVKEFLSEVFDEASKKSLLVALEEASKGDQTVDAEAAAEVAEQAAKALEWAATYQSMVDSGWSDTDKRAWNGIYYTVDDHGEALLVARVSPKNHEVRIIGKGYADLLDKYNGLYMDSAKTISRSSFVLKLLKDTIVRECNAQTPGHRTSKEILESMPASVANVLYQVAPQVQKDSDPPMITGWAVKFATNSHNYPTVESYLRQSIDTFLAKPEYEIKNISIASRDPDEFTYKFIDPEIFTQGPTDIWDKWGKDTFETLDQYHCFQAWVGSIFVPENTSKQVCWLQGAGNMGLSKVHNSLYRLMGAHAVASFGNSEGLGSRFASAGVMGKRLVLIADSKNPNIVRTGVVHNWSGGDICSIERKGKDAYAAHIYAKVFVCENISPTINIEEDNQLARILYFKLKRRTEEEKIAMGIGAIIDGKYVDIGNGAFQAQLDSQVHAWIYACLQQYALRCPSNAQIAPYDGHIEALKGECADPTSDAIINWIDKNLVKDVNSSLDWDVFVENFRESTPKLNHSNPLIVKQLKLILEKYFDIWLSRNARKGEKQKIKGWKINPESALATLAPRQFTYNKPATEGEV